MSLIPFEQNFRTAIRSRWSRFPGSAALTIMHGIYVQVTGNNQRLNASCSTCILRLLTELGNIYFKDKEDREEIRRVSVLEKQIPKEEKVEVKTKKRERKPKTE